LITIGKSITTTHSTPAEPEVRHWQLLRRGPAIVLHQFSCPAFAAELNLRRHQQDRVLAGINDREQDRDLISAIKDFADSNPEPVSFRVFCFDPLSIQYGEWSRFLPTQQIIQRGRWSQSRSGVNSCCFGPIQVQCSWQKLRPILGVGVGRTRCGARSFDGCSLSNQGERHDLWLDQEADSWLVLKEKINS
jgi:hypothetical protein